MIPLLLKGGADVNARDKFGLTAEKAARRKGYTEIISLLDDWKARPPEMVAEQAAERANSKKEAETKSELNADYDQAKDRALSTIHNGPHFPTLSESYRREMVVGLQNIRDARNSNDEIQAFDHFLKASELAPWAPPTLRGHGTNCRSVKKLQDGRGFFKVVSAGRPESTGCPEYSGPYLRAGR